jgi:hypothetical protein
MENMLNGENWIEIEHISVNNWQTWKKFKLLSFYGLIKPNNHLTQLSL